MKHLAFLDGLPALAERLRRADLVLSGDAAAHVHLASATESVPGEPPRYSALPPRAVEAIGGADAAEVDGVTRDVSPVAMVLQQRLELFVREIRLRDGTSVRTLSREAVLAQLLAKGGLAIALAGALLSVTRETPIDPDDVREILKAARQGERFQPLLELLDVA